MVCAGDRSGNESAANSTAKLKVFFIANSPCVQSLKREKSLGNRVGGAGRQVEGRPGGQFHQGTMQMRDDRQMRRDLIELLEKSLSIADELNFGVVGYMIDGALDAARAEAVQIASSSARDHQKD